MRSSRIAAVAGAAAAALAVAAPAAGQKDLGPYEQFSFAYTAKAPGAPTGFRYRVALATNGDEQPPVVRELRLTFHPGTRFDLGAVARCAASDEAIAEDGTDACPAKSRVAGGTAGVYAGAATPLELDAAVFNAATGIVVVLTTAEGAVIRTLRGRLSADRRQFTIPIPAVPLPEGREAALVRFALDIARAGTRRRPWARTPRTCPRAGWATTYAPRFDTLGRVTLTDVTRCRR